ncbi:MAG: GNAT family N-acetyltransferase [Panacagrimonas sp.]
MNAYSITALQAEDRDTASAILDLLIDYNLPFFGGRPPIHTVQLAARDPNGVLVGGLLGQVRVHWLHVDILVAAPGYRKSGLGSELMAQAERIAREHACAGIWLDTFEFQAPGFYEKLGFTRCGSIRNFWNGHDRHIYEKRL